MLFKVKIDKIQNREFSVGHISLRAARNRFKSWVLKHSSLYGFILSEGRISGKQRDRDTG
jgi:predicted metalloenzyme YecM